MGKDRKRKGPKGWDGGIISSSREKGGEKGGGRGEGMKGRGEEGGGGRKEEGRGPRGEGREGGNGPCLKVTGLWRAALPMEVPRVVAVQEDMKVGELSLLEESARIMKL